MEKQPTVEEIKDKFKDYERYYSALHQQQKEIDNYYELTFIAGVPKRYKQFTPPTAREWIDVGVRHFTLDNPKATVPPRGMSDIARAKDAKLETFFNFWLRRSILRIKDAAKKLPLRGEVFIKVGMDDTYYGVGELSEEQRAKFEEARLFHFPLKITIPDPINVYASPAHDGLVPVNVIESYNMTVAEAQNLCKRNNWEWSTDKKSTDSVNWLSYYDANWRCFLIDDIPVLSPIASINLLGFCPYAHIASGSGQSSYEGKPEYLYRSLLWSRRDALNLEARNLSQTDAILSRYAWIRHKIKGEPDAIKLLYPDGKIPTDPDEFLREMEGVEIQVLQGEQPPPGLFQQYAIIQALASPPSVLGGFRSAGVYSGRLQEDLMATAKPIYKDVFNNLEDVLGVIMGMGARIIDKVYGHPVAIRDFASEAKREHIVLKPEDIDGHYDCEVKLLAEPPEATDMRKALGRTMRQGGSISHKTELRKYHDMSEEEAENEMAQIHAEDAMKEPSVRGGIALDAMERLGMHKALEQIRQAMQTEKQRIARPIPPIQQTGEIRTGAEMVRKRGRVMPELESIPTPHETEITGGLG